MYTHIYTRPDDYTHRRREIHIDVSRPRRCLAGVVFCFGFFFFLFVLFLLPSLRYPAGGKNERRTNLLFCYMSDEEEFSSKDLVSSVLLLSSSLSSIAFRTIFRECVFFSFQTQVFIFMLVVVVLLRLRRRHHRFLLWMLMCCR